MGNLFIDISYAFPNFCLGMPPIQGQIREIGVGGEGRSVRIRDM
jgi:hypothetical protein